VGVHLTITRISVPPC